MNVKMSPYIFCNFSSGSLRHEPVHFLQKMYGDFFNFNCSYLSRFLLYFSQIFSVIIVFESALSEYVIQIKKTWKKFFCDVTLKYSIAVIQR